MMNTDVNMMLDNDDATFKPGQQVMYLTFAAL
jgi:hypothetical protein